MKVSLQPPCAPPASVAPQHKGTKGRGVPPLRKEEEDRVSETKEGEETGEDVEEGSGMR